MRESEEIDKVVNALQKVPEKRLLIIELANSIPIKNGLLDLEVMSEKQREINLACRKVEGRPTAAVCTPAGFYEH